MEVKNKTLEIHRQEAFEEGFEHGSSVTRESIGGYKEYDVGLTITRITYQLRQQIAEELLEIAKQNDSQILPVFIAVTTVLNRPIPEEWRTRYGI